MLPLVKTSSRHPASAEAALGGNATLGSLTDVNVNGPRGSPGCDLHLERHAFKAKVYFLIKGHLDYQATAQAAEVQVERPAARVQTDDGTASKSRQ